MINIVQAGLGPIGRQLTSYLLQREGLKIFAAVDPDESIKGKDVGLLAGHKPIGIFVSKSPGNRSFDPQQSVALVSTVSKISRITSQVQEYASRGLNILTTCEELTHPWTTHSEEAVEIDEICKKYGVTCLATGVNPGFLMDYLPAVFSSVCRVVDHIKISRVQNASGRRGSFQKKIGAGLSVDEFRKRQGKLGHVGLPESTHFIAEALNLKLTDYVENIEPVIADQTIITDHVTVKPGMVSGLNQSAIGFIDGKEAIRQEFIAAVGQDDPADRIDITGDPEFHSVIPGGINGDVATASIIINSIPVILKMEPGLKTMLDVSVPSWFKKID